MKKIKLTKNKYALVDDKDYSYLNQFKWRAINKKDYTSYAIKSVYSKIEKRRKGIYMHRDIMNPLDNMQIDHRDGNGLNNQKENLRICTQTQNNGNRKISKNNKSGIKGVSWHKNKNKWQTNIKINYKSKHLGYFSDIGDAKKAYTKAAKEYFGEFYLNKL